MAERSEQSKTHPDLASHRRRPISQTTGIRAAQGRHEENSQGQLG